MIRLTACISGRVQRVGYRAKVVSLAREMGLVGVIQNRPDGSVLVIAEGEKKEELERFASAIAIKNALIRADSVDFQFSMGSGQYSTFRKITGPEEVGERLDDGVEILKEMLIDIRNLAVSVNNLTTLTEDGFENLTTITKDGFENLTTITEDGFENLTTITKDGFENLTTITEDGFENLGGKMDQTLDRQDETIDEIRGMRSDLHESANKRLARIEEEIVEIKRSIRELGGSCN